MDTPPDFTPQRRPRFDPTINLGHIASALTTMVVGGTALVTIWTNFRVSEADMQGRLKTHDDAISDLRATTQRLVETQQQQAMTEQKLSLTLDYLAKQSSNNH